MMCIEYENGSYILSAMIEEYHEFYSFNDICDFTDILYGLENCGNCKYKYDNTVCTATSTYRKGLE